MSDTAPPPGQELLRQRLAAIPGGLESLGRDWPGRSPKAGTPSRVVVTGLGSSEAHARYLVRLLNRRTRIPAEFLPTGAFVDCGFGGWADRTLVVFSQGLSANARIALARRDAFRGLVLFTAATPEGLVAAGKAERAEFLRGLVFVCSD
jgi:creatinine amidohydrolase